MLLFTMFQFHAETDLNCDVVEEIGDYGVYRLLKNALLTFHETIMVATHISCNYFQQENQRNTKRTSCRDHLKWKLKQYKELSRFVTNTGKINCFWVIALFLYLACECLRNLTLLVRLLQLKILL